MIKINFLGEDQGASSDSIKWLAAYAGSMALAVLLCIGVYTVVGLEISSLDEDVTASRAQLAALKEKTKEISDLEKRKAELEGMTVAIAALKKGQEGPVKMLEDLNVALPDRAWLSNASFRSKQMRLEGIALNDEAIVAFIQQLKQSPYFDDVRLVDRTTVPLSQINIYNEHDGSQGRVVSRGEQASVQQKYKEIKDYATRLGLEFREGVPELAAKANQGEGLTAGGSMSVSKLSFNAQNATGGSRADGGGAPSIISDFDGAKRRNFGGGGRSTGGRPVLFVWQALQSRDGENFVIEAKLSYTPKHLNVEALEQALKPKVETKKPAAKNARKSEEEL